MTSTAWHCLKKRFFSKSIDFSGDKCYNVVAIPQRLIHFYNVYLRKALNDQGIYNFKKERIIEL